MNQSSLEPRVRVFVEWRLEHYRVDKRTIQQYRAILTASELPPSELCPSALDAKLFASPFLLEMERGVLAVEHVAETLPPERLKLIDLVYWKATHTMQGAAAVLHISRRTAYNWRNEVLTAIAAELGYTKA